MDKFESEENVKSFLYVVARNASFNELAKLKRQTYKTVELEYVEDILPVVVPKYDFDVIEAEVLAFIEEQIETLPRGRREAIKLFMKGLDWHEVGKQLGCSSKTAINQKLKAIKYLRELVKIKFDI